MHNIWIGLIALTLAGCAVVKNEPNKNETVAIALGGACAVNVKADSYQVACANTDASKVVQAIQKIKASRQ